MHWTQHLFDNTWTQREHIEGLRRVSRMASRRHESKLKSVKARIEEMEAWLGELALLNQTMLKLLLDKGVFTIDEMKAVFDELDLLDGVKDGKLASAKPEDEEKKPKAPKKIAKGRKIRRKGDRE